jgi:hypothetical protein
MGMRWSVHDLGRFGLATGWADLVMGWPWGCCWDGQGWAMCCIRHALVSASHWLAMGIVARGLGCKCAVFEMVLPAHGLGSPRAGLSMCWAGHDLG